MAGGIYSTRFVLASAPASTSYVVPPGKRAVVKQVTVFNGGGAAAVCALSIAGTGVWAASVPGGNGGLGTGVMLVAYPGESISLYLGAANMGGSVSGFLFENA